MKKQMLKSAVIALAGVGLMSGVALADPEPTLDAVLASKVIGQTITTANDTKTEAWMIAEGAVDSYLVSLISSASGSLWIYKTGDISTAYKLSLVNGKSSFSINDFGDLSVNDVTVKTGFGSVFSFYWETASNKAATETKQNYDNYDSVYSFLVNEGAKVITQYNTQTTVTASGYNDWILAFEDQAGGGDGDHQDAIFYMEDMKAVPEPATMLLFGTGIIGLAGIARRKQIS